MFIAYSTSGSNFSTNEQMDKKRLKFAFPVTIDAALQKTPNQCKTCYNIIPQ